MKPKKLKKLTPAQAQHRLRSGVPTIVVSGNAPVEIAQKLEAYAKTLNRCDIADHPFYGSHFARVIRALSSIQEVAVSRLVEANHLSEAATMIESFIRRLMYKALDVSEWEYLNPKVFMKDAHRGVLHFVVTDIGKAKENGRWWAYSKGKVPVSPKGPDLALLFSKHAMQRVTERIDGIDCDNFIFCGTQGCIEKTDFTAPTDISSVRKEYRQTGGDTLLECWGFLKATTKALLGTPDEHLMRNGGFTMYLPAMYLAGAPDGLGNFCVKTVLTPFMAGTPQHIWLKRTYKENPELYAKIVATMLKDSNTTEERILKFLQMLRNPVQLGEEYCLNYELLYKLLLMCLREGYIDEKVIHQPDVDYNERLAIFKQSEGARALERFGYPGNPPAPRSFYGFDEDGEMF